jgi:hypothetical protein
VNENGKLTFDAVQIMHFTLYYSNHVFPFNQRTKLVKNIIICLGKHVDADHSKILRTFKEEMISIMKRSLEKQPTKKRLNIFGSCCNPILRECEDEIHIPEMGIWESSGTFETLDFDFRGQNTSHWGFFYIIEKLSKYICQK